MMLTSNFSPSIISLMMLLFLYMPICQIICQDPPVLPDEFHLACQHCHTDQFPGHLACFSNSESGLFIGANILAGLTCGASCAE